MYIETHEYEGSIRLGSEIFREHLLGSLEKFCNKNKRIYN